MTGGRKPASIASGEAATDWRTSGRSRRKTVPPRRTAVVVFPAARGPTSEIAGKEASSSSSRPSTILGTYKSLTNPAYLFPAWINTCFPQMRLPVSRNLTMQPQPAVPTPPPL